MCIRDSDFHCMRTLGRDHRQSSCDRGAWMDRVGASLRTSRDRIWWRTKQWCAFQVATAS
eukprot:12570099-Prorocentrum_lima.AAC.1